MHHSTQRLWSLWSSNVEFKIALGDVFELTNRVNTSVTSVDSSADCATGPGVLSGTNQLEEPQLLCWEKPWGWTS